MAASLAERRSLSSELASCQSRLTQLQSDVGAAEARAGALALEAEAARGQAQRERERAEVAERAVVEAREGAERERERAEGAERERDALALRLGEVEGRQVGGGWGAVEGRWGVYA